LINSAFDFKNRGCFDMAVGIAKYPPIFELKRRMEREARGLGELLVCPQGKAASPRFMGVVVLGDVC
jgi:hypothetical protein